MDKRDWATLQEMNPVVKVRMIENNTWQRNSRRTLGQVRLAVIAAFSGKRVYYMCGTKESAEYSMRIALDSCADAISNLSAVVFVHNRRIEFPGFGGFVEFRTALPELRGTRNVEVHVDHFVQENKP